MPEVTPPPALIPTATWECHLHLTNNSRAPRIARRTIRTALLDYNYSLELADTAELLTSELVSNSVKHSDGPVAVRLRTRAGVVRIGVMDDHPELPAPLPCTPDEDFGRGLYLVEALADCWGRYPLPNRSRTPGWKVVWFELAADRE
ncbi:ATP-binding protein [Streptomyces yerevanensis]|uniref:ATP-binding protein n=1 Tax=Streptomyces yerevanensis TaxID=66378 RepID=UPI0005271F61|nr:ATP-binding protein [Streptomyces yerevanensis]